MAQIYLSTDQMNLNDNKELKYIQIQLHSIVVVFFTPPQNGKLPLLSLRCTLAHIVLLSCRVTTNTNDHICVCVSHEQ